MVGCCYANEVIGPVHFCPNLQVPHYAELGKEEEEEEEVRRSNKEKEQKENE